MSETLDDLVSELNRKMYRALDNAIEYDRENLYEGDPDDYDGLDEYALEELQDALASEIVAGIIVDSDEFSLEEILNAALEMYDQRGSSEGDWEYDTIQMALSQLEE